MDEEEIEETKKEANKLGHDPNIPSKRSMSLGRWRRRPGPGRQTYREDGVAAVAVDVA
jgi:hypothetical protein